MGVRLALLSLLKTVNRGQWSGKKKGLRKGNPQMDADFRRLKKGNPQITQMNKKNKGHS